MSLTPASTWIPPPALKCNPLFLSKDAPTWKSALTETLTSVFPKVALAPAFPFTPAWADAPFLLAFILAPASPFAEASILATFFPFIFNPAPALYSFPTFAWALNLPFLDWIEALP